MASSCNRISSNLVHRPTRQKPNQNTFTETKDLRILERYVNTVTIEVRTETQLTLRSSDGAFGTGRGRGRSKGSTYFTIKLIQDIIVTRGRDGSISRFGSRVCLDFHLFVSLYLTYSLTCPRTPLAPSGAVQGRGGTPPFLPFHACGLRTKTFSSRFAPFVSVVTPLLRVKKEGDAGHEHFQTFPSFLPLYVDSFVTLGEGDGGVCADLLRVRTDVGPDTTLK